VSLLSLPRAFEAGADQRSAERQTPESGGTLGALAASGAGAALAAAFLPKKKAMKIEEIPAKFPGAKRMRLLYGPYVLKAANVSLRPVSSTSGSDNHHRVLQRSVMA